MIIIEEAMFLQVIKEIVGRGIKIELRNRPSGAAFAAVRGARVEIVLPSSWRKIGEDERRENIVLVGGVEQLEEEYVRTREGTISIRVECDSGIRVDLRATNIAEDIRNALRKQRWRDRIRECGIAVATMRNVIDTEMVWDERAIDVAVLDIDVNATYSDKDQDADYFTVVNEGNRVPRDRTIPTPEYPNGFPN